MDEQTALVLALQLVALFSIAGALLLYLFCKIRANNGEHLYENSPGAGKPVLITSCDNVFGLQIALHLANSGFRVFAGVKDAREDSVPSKVIRAWQKHRESVQGHGAIVALPFDVTREDLLHEAVDIIRAHLPAGEDGIWAVICTSGLCFRGSLIQQDVSHWESIIRTNLLGLLRTARTFQSLLRNANGRIITVGTTSNLGAGLVAYASSRHAVEGASHALREELLPQGIKVVTLKPQGVLPELLFSQPKLILKNDDVETSVDLSGCMEFQPMVLSAAALEVLDVALTSRTPKFNYTLEYKNNKWAKPLSILRIV